MTTYQKFTAKMALDLAAPHTWPACILPAFISLCLAAMKGPISVTLSISLLAIVILMQSAVNTFNDYYDYVKGSDSPEDNIDVDDAVLVYNNINPKAALILAIALLGCAFILGIYPIVIAGPIPLIIGIIGAIFVVIYSAGKTPLSYLPLGEIVSGIVMGGLIPLAIYFVLTNELNFLVLLWVLPEIIFVGLIMATNNISDIERDIPSGRHTLAVLLGRKKSVRLYRIFLIVWIGAIIFNSSIWFPKGLLVFPFMILAAYPLLKAIFSNPLIPERRQQSMPQILSLGIVLGAFYGAMILAGSTYPVILSF